MNLSQIPVGKHGIQPTDLAKPDPVEDPLGRSFPANELARWEMEARHCRPPIPVDSVTGDPVAADQYRS